MKLYATSHNTGPSWSGPDPKYLTYLGTSLSHAIEAVDANFRRYETDEFPTQYPHIYSAIPPELDRKMIKFWSADGWWQSIVELDIPEVVNL